MPSGPPGPWNGGLDPDIRTSYGSFATNDVRVPVPTSRIFQQKRSHTTRGMRYEGRASNP